MDPSASGGKRPWTALQSESGQYKECDEEYHPGGAKRPRSPNTWLQPTQPMTSETQSHYELLPSSEEFLPTLYSFDAADSLTSLGYVQGGSDFQASLWHDPTPQVVLADHDEAPSTQTPSTPDAEGLHPTYDTCFGMVQLDNPKLQLQALGHTGQTRVDVNLQLNGRIIIVRNKQTSAYGGLLCGDEIQAVIKLTESFTITLVAYLIVSKAAKKELPQYVLCIIIHGERSSANEVGTVLGSSGVYLQPPQEFHPSVPYFNPQYLRRPGTERSENTPYGLLESQIASSVVFPENDPLKYQVLQAFDAAHGPSVYKNVSPSPRLKTTLKEHQLKALSMMIEKESGRLENTEFGRLWIPAMGPNGSIRYKNTVIDIFQVEKPPLCLGGLLADDMGLGKTLSTLVLITAHLDHVEHAIIPEDEPNPKNSTLIVTPMSRKVLLTWEEQIKGHIDRDKISYHVYHGVGKRKQASALKNYDIVLTTYDTLAAESRKGDNRAGKKANQISLLEWNRIVLDEAHLIRNASSKRHQIICQLKATHRWCLTGSPMFNRVEDFGSLLNFLRVVPFDDTSFFNAHVSNPLKREPEKAIATLRKLVQNVSLRRTKDSVFGELHLPHRHNQTTEVALDPEEQRLYDLLKRSYAMIFETPTTEVQSTPCIFQTIMRLRQFCNHGLDLLPRSALAVFDDSMNSKAIADELLRAAQTCASCKKAIKKRTYGTNADALLDCGHQLCNRCQKKQQDVTVEALIKCNLCSDARTPGTLSPSPCVSNSMDIDIPYKPSSKVKALLQNLLADRNIAVSPPIKSVIFSCWTKMLDQIGKALHANSLRFERIDGSKSDTQRRSALERFRKDPGCCILLASIGSAGVGLDLTIASRVHLMEPQWSPMAEEQALDRMHRMGQTREVVATRYIMKNSIEEYVISVQEMKSRVIKQSFDTDAAAETLNARERLIKYLEQA